MAKFCFTNKAVEDLSDIWNYTFDTWSPQQADKYYNMLIDLCRKIAENPLLFGEKYDRIDKNIYGYKAVRHIIFYRIVSVNEIEIVRILHSCMDLKNRIRES
jgi:toxin ParE1/3/4